MKMIDVVINIDSLSLKENESVEDVIEHLRKRFHFGYEPQWEILYEELIE